MAFLMINFKPFIEKNLYELFYVGFILFCILPFSQNSFAQNGTLGGQYGSNKIIIPYPHLHESEVMWSKQIWRVIDLREKFNADFSLPSEPTSKSKSLMQAIWDAVTVEQSITPFEDEKDGELKTVIPVDVLLRRFNYFDTIQEDGTENASLAKKIVPHLFNPKEVKQFRVKEEWYFDKQQALIDVRIIAICPMLFTVKNNEPIVIPMFWFYFPEARTPLKKVDVYKAITDTTKMNYETVFLKRKFESFVYKQSNVYNKRISRHLAGADGLLESETIKQEMRNAEEDWWEY